MIPITTQVCRSRHQGMVYLLVLGMGTLVSVMVMGVLISNRLSARQTAQGSDVHQAEVLAESAIEYALAKLAADTSWRTTYSNNVATTPLSVLAGTISFKLVDESTGSLTASPGDPVRIYGYGVSGKSTKIFSVQASGSAGLTCLNAPLVVGGNFSMNQSTIQAIGSTLASNASITGSGSGGGTTVNANVEAVGTISPGAVTITGTTTPGVTARTMPASTVFDYYLANGTTISYSSISGGTIQNVVLSPSSNPYSLLGLVTNPKGIYVIDCGNQVLKVMHCRIVGTLVILNPGAGSSIGNNGAGADYINWVPAVTNYPCLLCRGNMTIAFNDKPGKVLDESANGGVNFNPLGTPYPYPSGTTNLNTTDTYPSVISGLIYVSGNVTGGSGSCPALQVMVAGGTYDAGSDNVSFSYTSNYLNSPPPGFASGGGQVVPITGTWKWETLP